MVLWCLCPIPTSLDNNLGLYDGLSGVIQQTVSWGFPYLAGRLYFSDREGLRELAIGLFIGGLVYIPFCLFEIRMSPQLHTWVYGFHQHAFSQTHRFGGWRPTVFLQHGLVVGMWMSMAALVGLWLWLCGSLKRLFGIHMGVLAGALLATAVLCKSVGALVLMAFGVAVLFGIKGMRRPTPFLVLLVVPLAYASVRMTGLWDARELGEIARHIDAGRSQSLRYRLDAEETFIRHALQKPVFGWGGWGRNRPANFNPEITDYATDGLWILALGVNGLVGLTAFFASLMVPVWFAYRNRRPGTDWLQPDDAPVSALAAVSALYLIDCLPNAMVNPIYISAVGGLAGLCVTGPYQTPAQTDLDDSGNVSDEA
jgi:O-antigen ligase